MGWGERRQHAIRRIKPGVKSDVGTKEELEKYTGRFADGFYMV